ncbi:hypothetical protein QQ008_00045 [Fulvivirgaceae bacterium BMA10]|uniref:Tetratricopeptide repeat protein n=1 Tax=Splendidivirga corallicola TaxID=3051826 RepID=A0ABT8KG73_9BACT|nr:hypothetical protein [Fulvivirgaceae bacterium BMA10]
MKYLLVLLLALNPINDLNKIAKVNKLKKQAQEAYLDGDYQKAIKHYSFLIDSLDVADDDVLLNLSNAYYKVADSANALNNYQKLTSSNNRQVKSIANQQLGIYANAKKQHKEALEYFKQSLKSDPTNEEARYNYELLKKLLKDQEQEDQNKDKQDQKDQDKQDQEKKDQQNKDQQEQNKDQEKEQDQKQQNQDQQQQDQQNKDGEKKEEEQQKDGEQKEQEEKQGKEEQQQQEESKEGEKKDELPKSISDKLEEMKISPDKAKMILEAMKNQEIQYLQQNKRKAKARPKSGKPDW